MASFWELNRRRKAVLKLAARAEQVNDLSVAIQRQAQRKAQKAKGAAKLPRGSEPGSLTSEQAALVVALDELNQVRNALNVSTNELQGVLKQVRPRVQFLGSNFRFLRSALSGEKRKTIGAELTQAEAALEIAHRLIGSRLSPEVLNLVRSRIPDTAEVMERFRQNNASFYATYEQLSEERPTADSRSSNKGRYGDIPFDIANRVELSPLDQGPLRATLRRYQDFGARYLIVQKTHVVRRRHGLG